jgi:hypothetical protein
MGSRTYVRIFSGLFGFADLLRAYAGRDLGFAFVGDLLSRFGFGQMGVWAKLPFVFAALMFGDHFWRHRTRCIGVSFLRAR